MSTLKRLRRIIAAEANELFDWLEDCQSRHNGKLEATLEEAEAARAEAFTAYRDCREKEEMMLAEQELADRKIVDALSRGSQDLARDLIREKVERDERLDEFDETVRLARRRLAVTTAARDEARERFEKAKAKAAAEAQVADAES